MKGRNSNVRKRDKHYGSMQDGPFAEDMHHCNYTSTNQLAATVNADTPWACPCQTNMKAQLHEGDWAAAGIPFVQGTNDLVSTIQDLAGRSSSATSTVVVADRAYAYDANGNMTTNGVFTYVWDCENRLTEVWKNGILVQVNRYDALWRRREKIEYAPDGTAVTNRYIYKDWLVLAITDGTDTLLETYTHGTDLSGKVGGSAGGIGGILNSAHAIGTVTYHYDFNGNIVASCFSNQNTLALLSYTPFGKVLTRIGTFVPRYQFSTKEEDPCVDLIYYGYRYYSASLGRWIGRDLLGEAVSLNVYVAYDNMAFIALDYLGLSIWSRLKSGISWIYGKISLCLRIPEERYAFIECPSIDGSYNHCWNHCIATKCIGFHPYATILMQGMSAVLEFPWNKIDSLHDIRSNLNGTLNAFNLEGCSNGCYAYARREQEKHCCPKKPYMDKENPECCQEKQ